MPEPASPNGKRRTPLHITTRIDWDTKTGLLQFDWKDGESTVFNLAELPQNIIDDLLYWGLIARIQQAYVSAKGSPLEARNRADQLWRLLKSGDWGLRRGEKSHSIVVEALALLLKIPAADAQARFSALSVEKRREVSNRSDVVSKISELKAKANPLQSLDSILR